MEEVERLQPRNNLSGRRELEVGDTDVEKVYITSYVPRRKCLSAQSDSLPTRARGGRVFFGSAAAFTSVGPNWVLLLLVSPGPGLAARGLSLMLICTASCKSSSAVGNQEWGKEMLCSPIGMISPATSQLICVVDKTAQQG